MRAAGLSSCFLSGHHASASVSRHGTVPASSSAAASASHSVRAVGGMTHAGASVDAASGHGLLRHSTNA